MTGRKIAVALALLLSATSATLAQTGNYSHTRGYIRLGLRGVARRPARVQARNRNASAIGAIPGKPGRTAGLSALMSPKPKIIPAGDYK
jgi:hypothetical protein